MPDPLNVKLSACLEGPMLKGICFLCSGSTTVIFSTVYCYFLILLIQYIRRVLDL